MTEIQNSRYTSNQNIDRIQHNVQGKCVCEACNCGKHHCPDPKKKGQYHSSYGDDYKGLATAPVRAKRPQQPLPETHYDPKDTLSSYQNNYQNPGPVASSRANRLQLINKNFILPTDKFSGESSYKGQYAGKNGARAQKSILPNNLKVSDQKFQGESTYQSNYIPGITQRTKPTQRPPSNTGLGKGKFEGLSSYNQEYQTKNQSRPEKFIQKNQIQLDTSPFSGSSSYGADYANKGVQARAQRAPQIKNQVMPEGKFQGDSIYHSNFVPGKIQKGQQFRPQGQLKVGGKFEGNSSYGADYADKGPSVKAERAPQIKNHIMPEGRFEGDSTYHANFIPGHMEKNTQFRPQQQLKVGGKFEGNSSYGAAYANNGPSVRAERAPQVKNQIMPQGKFKGESTYHDNYIPGQIEKNPQFRPQGQLKIGGAFEGSSSYGADYANKGSAIKAERAPQVKNHIMPEGRFEGDSTYHANFIPGQMQKNPQFRPQGQLQVGGKFQGNSSYGADYSNKGSPVKAERAPQVKNQIMPQGKFEGDSTYMNNYVPGKLEKNPQFRPIQQFKVGGKFEGSSSYGADYKHQNQPVKQICPTEILKAPKYEVSDKQHIRYNANNHSWE